VEDSSSAIYSVSQVAGYIKEFLDANPALQDLWVSGEVANARRYSSGHTYFSLRDSASSIQAVMFRGGEGSEHLKDGDQVNAHGRVSYYQVRGWVQLYVDLVRPAGLGALQAAFEELKKKLEAEGLFDPSRKRGLPAFPARVAVVTSPTGAVIQDILNVIGRRFPMVEVVLVPTPVQGRAAAPGVAAALAQANLLNDVDVVILARGGGSLEDLWAFNEEVVARAIFSSRVPVVCGVGHETDVTIADLVADLRAPTPSAAAEMVVPDMAELAADTREYTRRLSESLARRVRDARLGLTLATDRLHARMPSTSDAHARINELLRAASSSLSRTFELKRTQLRGLDAQMLSLAPTRVLERGYALVRKGPSGPVVTSAGAVAAGDVLEITMSDGSIDARAEAVRRRSRS